MNTLEKFKYWESKATYDLETARAMQKTGRYNYVVFMAQQAIEKKTPHHDAVFGGALIQFTPS